MVLELAEVVSERARSDLSLGLFLQPAVCELAEGHLAWFNELAAMDLGQTFGQQLLGVLTGVGRITPPSSRELAR